MTTIHPIALSRATVAAMSVLAAPSLLAGADEPAGWIKVNRQVVLPETIVDVSWAASYPKPILEEVIRDPDPTSPDEGLTPLYQTEVEVRVIGAAFGAVSKPYPVQGWVKTTSTGGWEQIFLGNNNSYNPHEVVWSKVVEPNERIDFKFQGSYDNSYDLKKPNTIGSWQPAIDTTSSSGRPYNRIVLVDGEVVPNYNPQLGQKDVHTHLAAYFEPGTKRLKLAENDFIYLTELSPFAKGHKDTDMQDLVLLVTFNKVEVVTAGKPNNGHGNNIDGVDVSNPGQGGGGPTGLNNAGLDPSGTVDDEKKNK